MTRVPGASAAALAAGEHPDHRRELREPALLAADAEHLDPVDARRVAAGEQPAPLVRALGHRLGVVQPALAERDRRAAVLGDVEVERLRGELGGRAHGGDLAARGLEVAEREEGRHAPAHRLGPEVDVAELVGEVARLVSASRTSLRRAWSRAPSSCRPAPARAPRGHRAAGPSRPPRRGPPRRARGCPGSRAHGPARRARRRAAAKAPHRAPPRRARAARPRAGR